MESLKSNIYPTISEVDIRIQPSWLLNDKNVREKLLPFALALTQNPDFLDIIQQGHQRMSRATNVSEIEETIASVKHKIGRMKMVNEDKGGQKEVISYWFPYGAIQPAIDAAWEAFWDPSQK